jgi:hypothetical protein
VGNFAGVELVAGGRRRFRLSPDRSDASPLAYQAGVLPALLAAAFDGWLAKRGIRFRVAWRALFGFVVSFLPLLGALSMGFLHGPYLTIFGLLGAAPAAACSWLSGSRAPRVRLPEAPS